MTDLIGEWLGPKPGLFICGVAYSAENLRIMVGALRPDILILDANFETHGLGPLCRHFYLTHSQLRIIVLTTGTSVEDLRHIFAGITTVPATGLRQLLPALRRITVCPPPAHSAPAAR
ncbi:MAG: hypothetical protein H7343_13815 [Undibacterium sp.]|nr:hypothetical protein [Opitutaceae bacterium]